IFGKGIFSLASILFAMLVGYAVAIFMGIIDLEPIQKASWFAIPVPFKYGMTFKLDAIFPILFLFIVTSIETIGDTTGVTQGGLNRDPTDNELKGSVLADGFSSTLASIFMVSPLTSFSQNVGLIRMTKVINRFSIATGALFLIVAGFIPKIGAVFTTVPASVLGGAVLIMFASIAVTGLNLLGQIEFNSKNSFIIAVALGVGVGFGQASGKVAIANLPEAVRLIFEGNGIAAATLIALFLNQVIPNKEK
ncbi:MAG: uracil-xanthine permease family protein, partial [Treponemataceae bacterium]